MGTCTNSMKRLFHRFTPQADHVRSRIWIRFAYLVIAVCFSPLVACDRRSDVSTSTTKTAAHPMTSTMSIAEAILHDNRERAMKLIQNGNSPDECSSDPSDPRSSLQLAAMDGDVEIVQMLLKAGSKVDFCPGKDRESPLYIASFLGHPKVVEILLTHGANPNLANVDGETPLHAAAFQGNPEIIRMLIVAGAKVNPFGASESPLHSVISHNSGDHAYTAAVALLDAGADINAVDTLGRSVLYVSIWENESKVASVLLEKGAKVNQPAPNFDSEITCAALNDEWDVVELLVKHGADINAADRTGKTALHYAAWRLEANAVKFLVGAGARKDIRDSQKQITPVEWVQFSKEADQTREQVRALLK